MSNQYREQVQDKDADYLDIKSKLGSIYGMCAAEYNDDDDLDYKDPATEYKKGQTNNE